MWSDEDTAELLDRVAGDEHGQVTPSVYETARLVTLAPWLAGHHARLDFLRERQQGDGGWPGPEGYTVVPTLSATLALLTQSRRAAPDQPLSRAAAAGLRALRHWLDPGRGLPIPDTIGMELIIPKLIDELNALSVPTGTAPLPMPRGFDRRSLEAAQSRFATGRLPHRVWTCLDVFGAAAAAAPFIRPAAGSVGCSTAATAAWLGGPDGDRDGVTFLRTVQARAGGPVPGVTPITYFEPAWVLNNIAIADGSVIAPAQMLDRLEASLTETGAPAAPGLPTDADDTAAVLAALIRHGRSPSLDSLLHYQAGDHFACFPDERNPSVSTNAHVLEALAVHLARHPRERARFAMPARVAAHWLLERQEADGCWWDKWHASPYYATACCVLALALHGDKGARPMLERSVRWILETQHADGSWGRWQGTVEETAYAIQVLAIAGTAGHATASVRRGRDFLASVPATAAHPPLWHAKDLYAPLNVVRAARLSAVRLSERIDRRSRPAALAG